jgi:hypothetical protein
MTNNNKYENNTSKKHFKNTPNVETRWKNVVTGRWTPFGEHLGVGNHSGKIKEY